MFLAYLVVAGPFVPFSPGLAYVGLVGQSFFALAAARGAASLTRHRKGTARRTIIVGIVALVFAILLWGGILGILGGAFSVTGGAIATKPPLYDVPLPVKGRLRAPERYSR